MNNHHMDHKSAVVASLAYSLYMLSLTLAPYGSTFFAWSGVQNLWVFEPRDFLENLLGFLPLGSILFFWLEPIPTSRPNKLAIAVCGAGLLSFTIETVQAFISERATQLADLLANVLGGALGYGLTRMVVTQGGFLGWLSAHRRSLIGGTLLLYVGFLGSYILFTADAEHLDEWGPDYHFAIGNEVTLDRPWLGRLFSVSLYDRALSAEEISFAFRAGPQDGNGVQVKLAAIASYCFCEGRDTIVHDRAAFAPPMDLEMMDGNAIWHPGGGLELQAPTILRTGRERPTKIYERFVASGSFSVATWMAPKDVQQDGPARIISFSIDHFARNFTLAQSRSEVSFRVRNHVAGANGSNLNLTTTELHLKPTITHLVAVYDRGREHLYVNGQERLTTIVLRGLPGIVNTFGFDVDSRWQGGWVVVLLTGPVGVLGYRLIRER
jgi:VanZ family protein